MKKGLIASKTARKMDTNKLGAYLAKKGMPVMGRMEKMGVKEERGESRKVKASEKKTGMEK